MKWESKMDKSDLDCIVAAILSAAVHGSDGTNPEFAVKKYAETLQKLREGWQCRESISIFTERLKTNPPASSETSGL